MRHLQINNKTELIKAIDLPVRLFHWLTVLTFTGAYLLAESYRDSHQILGYMLATLLSLRAIWGIIGSPQARFATFIASPRQLLQYCRELLQRKEKYTVSYNPLGATMILLMLINLGTLALSGHLLTTNRYWGDDNMAVLHYRSTQTMLALIPLHIAGVVYASFRQRQNLAKTMLTGYKRTN